MGYVIYAYVYYIVMNTYVFVHVPCGRLRSVTKFPKGDKRPNMPCGDKHVTVPCGRLSYVTKFPKADKSLTCPAGIHMLWFLTTESHSVAGQNNIPRQGEQICYKILSMHIFVI